MEFTLVYANDAEGRRERGREGERGRDRGRKRERGREGGIKEKGRKRERGREGERDEGREGREKKKEGERERENYRKVPSECSHSWNRPPLPPTELLRLKRLDPQSAPSGMAGSLHPPACSCECMRMWVQGPS